MLYRKEHPQMPTIPAKKPDSAGRSFAFALLFAAAGLGWIYLNLWASPVDHKIYWGTTILFWVAALALLALGCRQVVRRLRQRSPK
jgi:apolipoprotein N-acyltransferase